MNSVRHPKTVILSVASMLLSLLATTTLAVEAVRTEAGQKIDKHSHPASENVTSMAFTTSIDDGKPAASQKAFENTVNEIYFYTVLEGLEGQSVTHRWKYAGRVISNAAIAVTGDPFPTWSSNKMESNWTGFWTVEVLDKNDKVVGVSTFEYNHPRNIQMNPAANRHGHEDASDSGWGGGWGRGRGWGW